MSISVQSETSRDDIDTEENELEDLVWNLMSKTGLLSQIQGQISKFIEDNGDVKEMVVHPDRADGRILGCIFEYLQWVGMKHTTSVLLSESPVEVDVSIFESRVEGPNYKPELCGLFDDHNISEDKASNTHNYSRDEFEDSRLTSASGHHSIKSENEESLSANISEKEKEPSALQETTVQQVAVETLSLKSINSGEYTKAVPDEISSSPSASVVNDKKTEEDLNTSVDMINFNSPMVNKISEARPNVTLRQKAALTDLVTGSRDTLSESNSTPNVAQNKPDKLTAFVQTSNSLNEILARDRPVKDVIPRPPSRSASSKSNSISSEDFSSEKSAPHKASSEKPKSRQSPPLQKDNLETKEELSLEDESTSDLMDALTIEDDTQDASLDSDTKGMSSCEHAVNLK